jgi:hypothetical protein
MSKEIKKGSKGVIVTEDNDVCRLLQFCPDIEGWPTSWAGEEIDITPGREIVEFLKPFLLYLLTTKLSPKTLRRYRDHMWQLGGEVIGSLNDDPSLRRKPVEKVIFDLLEEEGGPLIWPQITEQQQDAFDASCRRLYRFLQTVIDKDKIILKN